MPDIILNSVPFHLEKKTVFKKLRTAENAEHAEDLSRLIQQANQIGKPKACYKISFLENKENDSVTAEGIKFTSQILRMKLDKVQRIFPYLATCGTELEDWSHSIIDVLYRYWADTIKEIVLRQAMNFLQEHLEASFKPGKIASLSPGRLPSWPITEQKPLFRLLGNMTESIGVKLTESFLMFPIKSVSGILFSTEEFFESCQLCPRENCPNRKVKFSPRKNCVFSDRRH